MQKQGLDLIQGTLEFIILWALADGDPRHGFGILNWIHETTQGALAIEEGALYPALHRMERRAWLVGEWGLSENSRKAKYYSLTGAGRDQLAKEAEGWTRYVAAIGRIMAGASKALN